MENGKYFFVEHVVTDKQGCDRWMGSWFDVFGAEDMTVDKARSYPEFEGNECVLTIPTCDGRLIMCLWKMPSGTSKDEFQAFIDRFFADHATNKVFEVDQALGIKKLDVRGYFTDLINASRGRQSPGYLDASTLWMSHHHIIDRKVWETDMNARLADQINKTCTTPSDCQTIFPAGHACCLTLFFTSNDVVCFDSAPEGFTQEDVRKLDDEFTLGLARNYVYKLDTAKGVNVFHLSEDDWSQDAMVWANSYMKTTQLDSTTVTTTTCIGIEISQ